MVKEIKPDLIISDHVFGEEKMGWQFIQRLKMDRETADIPLIVCSGAIKELKEMEGYLMSKDIGVLYKPFDVDELINLVEAKLSARKEFVYHSNGVKQRQPTCGRRRTLKRDCRENGDPKLPQSASVKSVERDAAEVLREQHAAIRITHKSNTYGLLRQYTR